MPTYIYGPQGCGKTSNAERLAAYFGCLSVIDEWHPGDERVIPEDALVLTNCPVSYGLPFSEAIKMVGRNEGCREDPLPTPTAEPSGSLSETHMNLPYPYIAARLALADLTNEVLASANLGLTGFGSIDPQNQAYAPFLEAGLISQDGTTINLAETIDALADEITNRMAAGTFV